MLANQTETTYSAVNAGEIRLNVDRQAPFLRAFGDGTLSFNWHAEGADSFADLVLHVFPYNNRKHP
jgi:hypothetical protein